MATIINIDDVAYGVAGDGTTDDTTAIQAVISGLPDRGGIIQFGPKTYRITSALVLGDGTNSTLSTKNGITLRGVGGVGLGEYSINDKGGGTKILYDGSTSTSAAVVRLAGPIARCSIIDIVLDCNSKAGIALDNIHGFKCRFVGGSSERWTTRGVSYTARTSYPSGTFEGCMDNVMDQWDSRDPSSTSTGMGLHLNGDLSSNVGCSRNTFRDCTFLIPGASGTYGIYQRFADNNSFLNCRMMWQGAPTSGKAIFHDYVAPGFPAGTFPRESFYLNPVAQGGIGFAGTPDYSNIIMGYAQSDGQPAVSASAGFRVMYNDGTFLNMSTGSGDGTPPTLSGSSPTDNATSVSISGNITLTFSEAVQAGAGNVVLVDNTNGTDNRTISVLDTSQVSFVSGAMTINPTSDLTNGTEYYVTMQPGVVKDLTGTSFAGLSGGTVSFTTVVLDVTAPTLSSSTPADNATSVSGSANIVLNFNESVQAGSGNIVITDLTAGTDTRTIAVGNAQVSISGSTVTINPTTDLNASNSYEVTMSSGVIKDLAGNNFAGLTTGQLNFTTGSADVTAPTLSSSTPTDGASSVALNSNIVLTFSESVQAGTGNIVITDLTNGVDTRTIAVSNGQITFSGSTCTINPTTDLLASKHYEVTMSSGVIKDLSNNNFAGISSGALDFNTVAASGWTTVYTANPTSTGATDLNGYNSRILLPGSLFASNYTKVRIKLKAPPSDDTVITNIFFGKKASSGDVYDFLSTPSRMTYSSANNVTMGAGSGEYQLDELTFSSTSGQAMLLSVSYSGVGSSYPSYASFTGGAHYTAASASVDVDTVNVSGYSTTSNIMALISKVEVFV